MDKIARFAILSLFLKRYGNRNRCESRFNSRVIDRVFSLFRFYFRVSLWIFCGVSSYALAEFSSEDSNNLNLISQEVWNINTKVGNIDSQTDTISNHTSNILKLYQSLGYTNYTGGTTLRSDILNLRDYLAALDDLNQEMLKGMGGSGQKWVGDSLGVRLDKIIAAIESLDTGGSGSETPEIPTDIATETTLSSFKGKYEEFANQFLNSWGFSQEHNLKSYFDNFFTARYYTWTTRIFTQPAGTSEGPMTPFPIKTPVAPGYKWFNTSPGSSTTTQSFNNVFEWLQYAQDEMHGRYFLYTQNLFKKQAWNDWYAHTNLVSTLYTLSSPPKNYIDKSSDIGSINAENGEMSIVYNDSEGGSPPTPEVIDTKVVYTNDFSILETDSTSIGNNLNEITYTKLNEKYKLPEGIETNNYQDYSSKESFPDYNLQYGTKEYQSFRFTAKHRSMYNSLFSPQLCDKLRAVFSKLWFFLSIWFNFVLFKVFGKIKD